MTLFRNFFCSTIGRKILMALTGLVLVGFVTGHLVGNLQIFSHPDKINGYAHFLQSLGPALWGIRAFLLACVVIHVWAAISLTFENKKARAIGYGAKNTIRATLASRTMRWSGFLVLAFIVYHLLHVTIGLPDDPNFKSSLKHYTMTSEFHLLGFPVVAAGADVHDVYTMVVYGFQNPIVSAAYAIAIALLSFHLLHGLQSMFQTLGLRNHRWATCLNTVARLFCLLYLLANLAIPGAILAGYVPCKTDAPAACCPAHPAAHK